MLVRKNKMYHVHLYAAVKQKVYITDSNWDKTIFTNTVLLIKNGHWYT